MQALVYNGKQASIGKFESFHELDQQPEEAEALVAGLLQSHCHFRTQKSQTETPIYAKKILGISS